MDRTATGDPAATFERLARATEPPRLAPDLAATLLTPALLIDLDRVRANAARALELCGGPGRWRPHVKTAKVPAVQVELARAGVRRFKCATTRELAVLLAALARDGVEDVDVLVAYPHAGPALGRIAALARAHPRAAVSLLVEDGASVGEVPAEVGIFLDVNGGMDRTGRPVADRAALLDAARAAGARLRGVHAYDGHRHEPDRGERERLVHAGLDPVVELCAALAAAGAPAGEVVTSGTPGFRAALSWPGWTALPEGWAHRVSPGTVVYHDLRSEELDPGGGFAPAALVLSRAVSRPRAGRVTLDAGSKALAAEAGEPCALVAGRPGLVPRTPSEEHLPVDVVAGEPPARGELLALVPRHVCPTVNLAEEAVLLEGGAPVAVAGVGARAHELGAPALPRLGELDALPPPSGGAAP